MLQLAVVLLTWISVIGLWWYTRRLRLDRRRSTALGLLVPAVAASALWWASQDIGLGGVIDGFVVLATVITIGAATAFTALGIGLSFLAEAVIGKKLPFWVAPM